MLTFKLLLSWMCLHWSMAVLFDAFDRKVFKRKKQRYATFDERGIMTLDGTVNGKSNDIGFPNLLNDDNFGQNICQKQPKLLFEICETQRLGPWTGLAICYQSQLNQPYVNPFFKTKISDTKVGISDTASTSHSRLIQVMCGQRQNAIFINRETPELNRDGIYILPKEQDQTVRASKKYEHFYSISTSFAPDKLYFRMRDDPSEKRCVILQLGGESLTKVNLTTLRREPIEEVYKEVKEGGDRKLVKMDYKTDAIFNKKFPDLANRKYRLSAEQGLWLLMLDFAPPYLRTQNMSIYGWLPVRIKITGQAIQPCKVDWVFLQSREVNGMKANLILSYTVNTGFNTADMKDKGTTNSSSTNDEKTDSGNIGGGGSISIPLSNMFSVNFGGNFQHSWSNVAGSGKEEQKISRQTFSSNAYENKDRMEKVEFEGFEGIIEVQQLVFACHGQTMKLDKIRYVDPNGEEVTPTQVQELQDTEDEYEAAQDEYIPPTYSQSCGDDYYECAVWAGRGDCRNNASTTAWMLTRCRLSCKVCAMVTVERKGNDPYANPPQEVQQPCLDIDSDCSQWKEDGECNKNPYVMSQACRKSCGLCVPRQDFKAIQREWRRNEGHDDYDYLYDQNQK